MKKIKRLFPYSALLVALLWTPLSKASAQPGVTVSFQTFYDDLSPYGTWVEDPQYGNVWVPNEGQGFRPYHTHGHWVMTDYGNTWVSDDPWGWAPYHYGRWTYDPYYGWVWVPGYEWGPAWVSWRYSDDYCGWAPLSPGISIGVSYNCPNDWWVFVGPQYLYRPDYDRYWRGPRYNTEIIGRTRFENNPYVDNGTRVRYNAGPRPQEIERVTHQAVPTYKLAPTSQHGRSAIQGNSVAMYRPAVKQAPNAHPDPAHTMRAPQPIGRPQPASINANRQAPFHAAVQQRQAPQNNSVKPGTNRPQQQQPQNRPQQQLQNRPQQQPQNRPQQQQPQNRPQQQAPNRPQQQQPQYRPQQQAPNRPQQQQPQYRPQQQPQSRPQEQPHQAPPQQQRPEPRMQQPPPQRQEPQHEAPHGEAPGRERR